jgi:hypothetical protein
MAWWLPPRRSLIRSMSIFLFFGSSYLHLEEESSLIFSPQSVEDGSTMVWYLAFWWWRKQFDFYPTRKRRLLGILLFNPFVYPRVLALELIRYMPAFLTSVWSVSWPCFSCRWWPTHWLLAETLQWTSSIQVCCLPLLHRFVPEHQPFFWEMVLMSFLT